MRKRKHRYKNWIIVTDKTVTGALRIRTSFVNKADFIFKMGLGNKSESGRYLGAKRVSLGIEEFDNNFYLMANIEDIARNLFKKKHLGKLFNELPEFKFYVEDEGGKFPLYSFTFPEEADILTIVVFGKKGYAAALEIIKITLDTLAEMDVVDPINIPIGEF